VLAAVKAASAIHDHALSLIPRLLIQVLAIPARNMNATGKTQHPLARMALSLGQEELASVAGQTLRLSASIRTSF